MNTVWIVLAAAVLLALLSGGKKGKSKVSGKPVRIDHPHYTSRDEYECGACGYRTYQALSSCPKCGIRFESVIRDEEEYMEEEDEEMDMDEEDGW